MLALLLVLALPPSEAWKAANVAVVLQHSGAQRSIGPAIMTLLNRLLDEKPEAVEVSLVGFDPLFRQVDNGRFTRKPAVLQPRTADIDSVKEVLANTPFNGPSPIYDAVLQALSPGKPDAKPGMILLFSNGLDNASETEFDDFLQKVAEAEIPVVVLYLPATPPAGGDKRLLKLAKNSGGKFIDLRVKDCWDQLVAALRVAPPAVPASKKPSN